MVFGFSRAEEMVPDAPALDTNEAGGSTEFGLDSARLAMLFAAMPDAMLVADENQVIRWANKAASDMFGLSVQELRGCALDRLIPEIHRDQHRSNVENFGRNGVTSRREMGHMDVLGLRADGAEIPLSAAISLCDDRDQRYYAVWLRNITQQKLLERELRIAKSEQEALADERTAQLESANDSLRQQSALRDSAESSLHERETRFGAVFNNASSFLGLLSPDGILLEVNQPALRFFGLALDEVVGRPFWETPWWQYSPEAKQKLKDAIRDAAQGQFVRFEMQDHDPEDGIVDVDFSLTPVKDASGKVVFLVPEGHRITELKTSQRELQKARDSLEILMNARTAELSTAHGLLSTVLNSVEEGIVVFDRDFRVQLWNRFLEDVTHNSFDAIKGKRPWDVWPVLRSHGVEAMLHRALQGETVVHDKLVGFDVRKGEVLPPGREPREEENDTVWMLTKYGPLRDGNAIIGVVSASLNLGELARVQARLKATNEKLRNLNAHLEKVREEERSRIARGIHDGVGGLITGIKAYVSTVIDQAQRANRPVDPKLERACELADTAADAVRRVIADLRPSVLDQLGIWAGLESLTKEIADAAALKSDFQISPSLQDVHLETSCSIALLRLVQEALTNVVRHARAHRVSVSVDMDDGKIIAAIEDDGTGVSDAALARTDAWGIIGMQERTQHIGGELRIVGSRSGGTLVIVIFPVGTESLD